MPLRTIRFAFEATYYLATTYISVIYETDIWVESAESAAG